MKKKLVKLMICLVSTLVCALTCLASVVPQTSESIPIESIGVYQLDKHLTVYSKPDFNSKVKYERTLDYPSLTSSNKDPLCAVLVPSKELGYIYVTDLSDDEEWVEIIYDKSENKRGWAHKNDEFQFMTWVDFINLYGRKYGMERLMTNDIGITGIYSNPDNNAQEIGKLSRPKTIKLTSIEGIWALVTVLDFSGNVTTGYIKWRDEAGKIYLFPLMK